MRSALRRLLSAFSASSHTVPVPTPRPDIRALETRIVFDAALVDTVADATSHATTTEADTGHNDISLFANHLAASPESTSNDRTSIAFFDANVDDIKSLLKGLDANVEVVLLDGTRDGITQIAEILSVRTGIDEIHIFSHGSEGALELGTGSITSDTMRTTYGDALATIKAALSDSADILIYGCDFGAGDEGQWTVDLLAELTGADVAASSDLTGSTSLGGDWDLEVHAGDIEAKVSISLATQIQWEHVLTRDTTGGETSVNTTNTSGTQETNVTSGRQIATDANGNYVVVWDNLNNGDVYVRKFAADGTALTGEIRANTTTANTQDEASVAMDANGNFVVVWRDSAADASWSGVYAQRFDANGNALGSQFRVNTTTANEQRYAAVAMNTTGFVVTWSSDGQDSSGYGIYGQQYDASGTKVGSEFRVNTYTLGTQSESNVAMNASGSFVITWTSGGQDGSSGGIYAQRYNASGVAQGSEFRVNSTTNNDQRYSSVGLDTSGNFVITWQSDGQDGSGIGIYAQRYASDGTALGSEFRANTNTSDQQQAANVALTGDGRFIITWRSQGQDGSGAGIYAQIFNADGTTQGSEFRANTTSPGEQEDPDAVWVGDRIVITWSGNGTGETSGIFTKRYTITNTPSLVASGGETGVNTTTAGNQQTNYLSGRQIAADANGNYVVVWEDTDTDDVYFRKYAADGTPITAEIRANTNTSGDQDEVSVAMDANGNFIVVWRDASLDGDGSGVYAQRYDTNGNALGSQFRVNTTTASEQRFAAVAMNTSGFVVTWASANVDTGGYAVVGQRYDSSGTKIGSEFRINTYQAGDQTESNVAMTASGAFVVTWTSNGQDGSDGGIYAQRYNASGVAQGSEFRINTTTSADQALSSVGIDANGNFVVSWQSWDQEGSFDEIYARRYSADGTALSGEFRVNTTIGGGNGPATSLSMKTAGSSSLGGAKARMEAAPAPMLRHTMPTARPATASSGSTRQQAVNSRPPM